MNIPETQTQFELVKQKDQGFRLHLNERAPIVAPANHEVLIRVRASSLNHRDLAITRGFYPVGGQDRLVPLSDGAGEVVALGPRAHRFRIGDRVAAIFFQRWLHGRAPEDVGASALGGAVHGMLAHYVTLNEAGLVAIPPSLSYEQAATLPCAGVTAWSALMHSGKLHSGDTVLLQGTGGVSVLALQIAIAAGAHVYITSSSDAKLDRARQLGATGLINYVDHPDWDKLVRELTGGHGVNHVLEVGGSGTLPRSLAAMSAGAHIALIGGLAGFGGEIPAVSLIGKNASVTGIYVGARDDFEALNAFVERHQIKPVIDREFEFFNAELAYEHMASASHFGKIVIRH